MKRYIFSTILFALVAATAVAQDEKKDSVMTFSDIDSLVIFDNGSQVSVTIKGVKNGEDAEFLLNGPSMEVGKHKVQYSKSSNEFRLYDDCPDDPTQPAYFLSCNLGLELGVIKNEAGGAETRINSLQSAEISWLNALKLTAEFPHRRDALSLSLGFTWRNFRRTNDKRFCTTEYETIYVGDYPEGSKPGFSRFKVFAVSVPFLWEHTYRTEKNGKHRYKFQMGLILNFNNYSSVLTKYDLNDKTVRETMSTEQHYPVTLDYYGAIDLWKGLGIYARASFGSLTQGVSSYDSVTSIVYTYAPEMHPVSIGVKWGF